MDDFVKRFNDYRAKILFLRRGFLLVNQLDDGMGKEVFGLMQDCHIMWQ